MTAQQENKEITISVIVPVHNVEAYLNECLSSLLFQSLESAEFIVIDDGSTDKSGQICDEFASKDSRFKVIHQENKGTLTARKTAFAAAKGKWCICLDGDDKLPFNRVLEIEVALANKYDADILRFDLEGISAKPENNLVPLNLKKRWYGVINTPYEIIKAVFSQGTILWGMAEKIYRTSIVKKTLPFVADTHLVCGTDCYQFFLICYFASTFLAIKTEPLYSYRVGCGISTSPPDVSKIKHQSKILLIPSYLRRFLEVEQQNKKYQNILKRLTERLLDEAVTRVSRLPLSDSATGFDSLFVNPDLRDSVVDFLIQKYWSSSTLLSQKIKGARFLASLPKKIRKIGIFYHRIYDGGVQRVISLQIPQFLEMGFKVVLFTEEIKEELEYNLLSTTERVILPSSFKHGRGAKLRKYLKEHNVDLLIYHAAHSNNLFFDGLVTKSLGIRFCITSHEICTLFLLDKCRHLSQFPFFYHIADALVVLNTMDLKFYSAMGIPTFYIPNPIQSLPLTPKTIRPNDVKNLVWIAQLDQFQNNYIEALKIFKLVCEKIDDVVCHIVGRGETADVGYITNYVKTNRLENKIIYEGFTTNLEKFLSTADVQLITSSFECFPMNLIEAKQYGIPVVLYELPYVELIKDQKGIISVPQHSVKEAAEAIIELLRNDSKREALSLASEQSLETFRRRVPSHIRSWKDIIDKLESKEFTPSNSQHEPFDPDWYNFWQTILFFQSENKQNKSEVINLSTYDRKKIERYENCLSFLLIFFPPQTLRYNLIKKVARKIYNYIKKYVRNK